MGTLAISQTLCAHTFVCVITPRRPRSQSLSFLWLHDEQENATPNCFFSCRRKASAEPTWRRCCGRRGWTCYGSSRLANWSWARVLTRKRVSGVVSLASRRAFLESSSIFRPDRILMNGIGFVLQQCVSLCFVLTTGLSDWLCRRQVKPRCKDSISHDGAFHAQAEYISLLYFEALFWCAAFALSVSAVSILTPDACRALRVVYRESLVRYGTCSQGRHQRDKELRRVFHVPPRDILRSSIFCAYQLHNTM